MRKIISNAGKVAFNPWFIIWASVSSIAGFFWYVHDRIAQYPPILSGLYFAASLIFLLSGIVYSLKVRSENVALKNIASTFNEINHIYRDALKNVFGGSDPVSNPRDLLAEEERLLRSVCQRIQNIFMRVTNRDCMVTIKLLLQEEGGKFFAHTYVRSLGDCDHDKFGRQKYEVGTGANTAFDTALLNLADGKTSRFFPPDLKQEENYSNERQRYENFYRITIVAPIRGINEGKEGTPEELR